jgi:uncharacterized protein YkwD
MGGWMMRLKKVMVLFLVIILSMPIYGCKINKNVNIISKNTIQQSFFGINNDGVTAEPTAIESASAEEENKAAANPVGQSGNEDDKGKGAVISSTPTAQPVPSSAQPVHTHSWIKSKVVGSTCTTGGYTLMSCSCGATQKTSITSALGHNLGPWETVTQATTTTTGIRKRTCTRCSYTETETIPKLASTIPNMINKVFRLVNEQRVANGLQKLAYRSDLQQAADIRAGEIIDSFSHTRPDGTECFTVFKEIGVTNYTWLGENIAKGYATPESVMDGWMNSPGHKANILKPEFEGIIIGVKKVDSNGYTGYAWVQLFITQ